MTNCKGVISIEYNTKLLTMIEQFVVYDEDEIRQRGDRYTQDLRKIRYCTITTDQIVCGL